MAAYHCCVPFCTSDSRYNAGKSISFHRIPAIHIEPKRHQEWLDRIRRDPGPYFKISTCTRVCSKHFLPSDFVRTLTGKRNLKSECVPSVFQWSEDSPEQVLFVKKKCLGASKNTLKPVQQIETEGIQSTESLQNGSFLDHCYDIPPISESEMLGAAREEIARLQEHTASLEGKLFFLERFSNDSTLLYFYTGFKDYTVLKNFFASLKPSSTNTVLWTQCQQDADVIAKDYGPIEQTLPLIDQFFLFLCKVRQGFCEQDLAVRFNVSQSTVIKTIITWANYLYIYVKDMFSWPSRKMIDQTMPGIFHVTYPQARVILSCIELKVEMSSFSTPASVRNKYTIVKGLLGISPCGNIIFKSSLYDGTASKKEMTQLCGILDLLEPKDVVIADTEFSIGELLDAIDVHLVEYPFESSDSLSTQRMETMGEEVAASEDVEIAEVTVGGEPTTMEEQVMSIQEETSLLEEQQSNRGDGLPDCTGEEQSATVAEEVPEIVGNGCPATVGEQALCDEEVQIEGVIGVPDSVGEEAPFVIGEEELPAQEFEDVHTLSEAEKMGCLTTHVEEVVERIKDYRLFDTVIPIHLASTVNQLWVVCAVLGTISGSQM